MWTGSALNPGTPPAQARLSRFKFPGVNNTKLVNTSTHRPQPSLPQPASIPIRARSRTTTAPTAITPTAKTSPHTPGLLFLTTFTTAFTTSPRARLAV